MATLFFFSRHKICEYEIFKDFYNLEKMGRNKSDGRLYFVIVPNYIRVNISCNELAIL